MHPPPARAPTHKARSALTAIGLVMTFAWPAMAQSPSAASLKPSDVFKGSKLAGAAWVSKHFSRGVSARIRQAVAAHGCPAENATLFRQQGKKAMVLLLPCYPKLPSVTSHEEDYEFLEYPLTLVLRGNQVSVVDMRPRGFMYDSGHVVAITDLDGNDMPEFWLAGTVCECDGDEADYGDEGCQCSGEMVVEFRQGRLQDWIAPSSTQAVGDRSR